MHIKVKIDKLLIKEQQESYENTKICLICKKKFGNKYAKDKKFVNLEIIIIKQQNIEVPLVAYVI